MIWKLIATIASHPRVTDWLIAHAQRTPYTHIRSADGESVYMYRYWLFNPYAAPGEYRRRGLRDWLPSVRLHRIMRPDNDRALHDHPWNARTIVLRGGYEEVRFTGDWQDATVRQWFPGYSIHDMTSPFVRAAGYTGRLLFGEYHRITWVSDGGVWTMFWTWRYRGSWGFDVDGVKVPWREYLGVKP